MVTPVAVRMYDPKAVGTYELSLAELKTPPENPFVSMAMLSSLVQFPWLLFMDSFIELYLKKRIERGRRKKIVICHTNIISRFVKVDYLEQVKVTFYS